MPGSSVSSQFGSRLARYFCCAGFNPAGDTGKNIDKCLIVPAVVCINGLTVTFRAVVASHGITQPNTKKCTGFTPTLVSQHIDSRFTEFRRLSPVKYFVHYSLPNVYLINLQDSNYKLVITNRV